MIWVESVAYLVDGICINLSPPRTVAEAAVMEEVVGREDREKGC